MLRALREFLKFRSEHSEEQRSCPQLKNTGYQSREKAKGWVITRTNFQFVVFVVDQNIFSQSFLTL